MNRHPQKRRVTTFLSNLEGGGAERVTVNLLKGFSPELFDLDLVLVDATGPFLAQVPEYVNVVDLRSGSVSRAALPLARFLRRAKPDVLVSHLSHVNVGAMIAKDLARTRARTVLVEHLNLSAARKRRSRLPHHRLLPQFVKLVYRRADVIVGVSEGVSEFIETRFALPPGKVRTIYNPVVDEELLRKSHEPLTHPWFEPGEPPVLLAVGRLTGQKDFATLLRAFARVQQKMPCRLLILGEGERREQLEALSSELGIQDDVQMPGFTENPYAYMRRAEVFVLSSLWEGLPTVLIEAMACGCPVVATDCPSGPREILEGGKWGPLVEVRDVQGLEEAILETLANPTPREKLEARAGKFSYKNAIDAYTDLLTTL